MIHSGLSLPFLFLLLLLFQILTLKIKVKLGHYSVHLHVIYPVKKGRHFSLRTEVLRLVAKGCFENIDFYCNKSQNLPSSTESEDSILCN